MDSLIAFLHNKIVGNVSFILVAALLVLSSFVLGKSYANVKSGNEQAVTIAPTETVVDDSVVVSSAISSPTPAQTKTAQKASTNQTGLININTASASDLDTLPGIGTTYAQRIIDYRAQNGAFTSVEELVNIKGIGPKTLDKLRPLVTI